MLGYSATIALFHLFLLFLGPAHAAPAMNVKRAVHSALRVARAGENLAESTTVETTNTLQTSVGTMIEKCTIQLDPITGDNSEPLVRETRTCTVSMGDGNNPPPAQNSDPQLTSNVGATATSSADATSTDGASASATETASASDASVTSADGSSPSTTDGNASATSASAPSSSGGAIKDDGVTFVPGSQLPSGATSANTASATATASDSTSAVSASNGAISPGGFTSTAASEVATASGSPTATVSGSAASVADAAATSAADTAETSAAKFELPGTHLSVLPIGLGVFAGISVIALIVVGLVTYERTKYRKAFRQRKLAESGAAMGYGGMAQAA